MFKNIAIVFIKSEPKLIEEASTITADGGNDRGGRGGYYYSEYKKGSTQVDPFLFKIVSSLGFKFQ